jgi:glutamine synthetase
MLKKYLEAKEEELRDYRLALTPWEIERYLEGLLSLPDL